jgi:hypothetical protein
MRSSIFGHGRIPRGPRPPGDDAPYYVGVEGVPHHKPHHAQGRTEVVRSAGSHAATRPAIRPGSTAAAMSRHGAGYLTRRHRHRHGPSVRAAGSWEVTPIRPYTGVPPP